MGLLPRSLEYTKMGHFYLLIIHLKIYMLQHREAPLKWGAYMTRRKITGGGEE